MIKKSKYLNFITYLLVQSAFLVSIPFAHAHVQQGQAIWMLPITFPLVMSLGAMMGLLGMPLPGIEVGIAISAIVLGIMVLREVRLNLNLAVILVGCFAVFHGHAHGTELPAGQSGLLYSMGFVTATGCLHGLGIAVGLIHRWPMGKLVLRGSGALIATMGVFFLWQAIA